MFGVQSAEGDHGPNDRTPGPPRGGRATLNFPTPPQYAGPGESQAENLIVQTHRHDKYGRAIADVLLPDGNNVNHTLDDQALLGESTTDAPST